jgi:hypothetical protein
MTQLTQEVLKRTLSSDQHILSADILNFEAINHYEEALPRSGHHGQFS